MSIPNMRHYRKIHPEKVEKTDVPDEVPEVVEEAPKKRGRKPKSKE